jgi:hypothetical protein
MNSSVTNEPTYVNPVTSECVGVLDPDPTREAWIKKEIRTARVHHRGRTPEASFHMNEQPVETITGKARAHKARALTSSELGPGRGNETAHSMTVTSTSSNDVSWF